MARPKQIADEVEKAVQLILDDHFPEKPWTHQASQAARYALESAMEQLANAKFDRGVRHATIANSGYNPNVPPAQKPTVQEVVEQEERMLGRKGAKEWFL